MSAIASKPIDARNPMIRTLVLGGLFIFIVQALHMWIVPVLIQKTPFIVAWQYIASGALGVSAFEGGIGTALVGVFFHLLISFIVAGIFIFAADRLPVLRRNLIVGGLLYGLGVFIVMNMIVIPLSATPPVPAPALPWVIEAALEHVLLIGLALGLLVRWMANSEN